MRDLQIADMHLFLRVADLGTLSAVARERDVPVSQVSRTLARIEKACDARLIHRSTHGLSLTAEGQTFSDYCRRMVGMLDELEGEFASKAREPGGLVRVAASTVVAQYQLVPSLPGLARRWPRLRIELEVGDRMNDMARDAIDIAIRTASNLPDTVVGDVLLRQGLLVPVLEKLVDANPVPVHAVTAPGRHRLPKIRACLDDWAEWSARPVRAEERAA